ncbi:hypothetical protein JK356_10050 [Streptomyces sp. 7-21]|nr:hypothetical protein [Streptomyces sp. 7-21]
MAKSVRVRCPECGREHTYVPCQYPCSCGAQVTLATAGTSVPVHHRTWAAAWTEVACAVCGRPGQWPQPEVDCPCGTTLRLASATAPGRPPEPEPAAERAPFRPLTIRTAYDALACAARFLRWLGFAEVHAAMSAPGSGIDLRGPGVVATVDPATLPTEERIIETLWLHGLNESAAPVAFSLAGYDQRARQRAGGLDVALFVFDLAGTPQPVNQAADTLLRTGPGGGDGDG